LWARWRALGSARRRLLLASAFGLALAAWQVKTWPFARIARGLGPAGSDLGDGAGPAPAAADLALARELRWALRALVRRLPVAPSCLMQALAARRLLLRRGVPCSLVFGVRGPSAGLDQGRRELAAHAWLRCGPLVVTGEQEAARFQPIAVYAAVPARGLPAR
jgi:hypothetical protein